MKEREMRIEGINFGKISSDGTEILRGKEKGRQESAPLRCGSELCH